MAKVKNNVDNNELVSLEAQAKGGKAVKNEKEDTQTQKTAPKKVKKTKKSLGRRFKEIFSELKKVSWPTFAKVVKQTGVVLVVVLCFLVIIGLTDVILSTLLNLLVA